jgi:translation initiation factor 5
MPIVNIPKDIDDPFFRYKRHTIETRIINKSNGITEMTNLNVISKELDRSPDDIIKFLKTRLGLRINKKHQIYTSCTNAANLEKLLEMYIKKHVLCKKCNNPETGQETLVCKACGASQ